MASTPTLHNQELPLYYIVKRGLTDEQMESVMVSLSITPCSAVFVSNVNDARTAVPFGERIVVAEDYPAALGWAEEWSREYGRPALVFGDAELLDAVYEDGRREPVPANA